MALVKYRIVFLFIVLLAAAASAPSVHGGRVYEITTATATREFSTAYDCKWVTKCAPQPPPEEKASYLVPCEKYLEPKYECVLKPNVDITRPPCLIGYVVNDNNKCVAIF